MTRRTTRIPVPVSAFDGEYSDIVVEVEPEHIVELNEIEEGDAVEQEELISIRPIPVDPKDFIRPSKEEEAARAAQELERNGWKSSVAVTNLLNTVVQESGFGASDFGFREDLDKTERDLQYNMTNGTEFSEHELYPTYKDLHGIHLYNFDPYLKIDLKAEDLTPGISEACKKCYLRDLENRVSMQHVFAVMTVGHSNLVYCIVARNGKPYYITQVLRAYWAGSQSREKTKKLIETPLDFTFEQKKRYNGGDNKGLARDLLTTAITKLIRTSRNLNNEDVKHLISKLNEMLTSLFTSDRDSYSSAEPRNLTILHYSLLMNCSSIYRKAIMTLIQKKNQGQKEAFRRGMNVGMLLFSELQKIGYHYDNTSRKWVKEVQLIPSMCYKSNQLWKIKPNKQKYKLTKLWISPEDFSANSYSEFHMTAEGNHPNVNSSGGVCIGGDLSSRWQRIMEQDTASGGTTLKDAVADFLMDVEESLEIPNFDSSFQQMDDFAGSTESAVLDLTEKRKGAPQRKWRELE